MLVSIFLFIGTLCTSFYKIQFDAINLAHNQYKNYCVHKPYDGIARSYKGEVFNPLQNFNNYLKINFIYIL